MIRILCRYMALSEVDGLHAIDEYKNMVHPLDYQFDVVPKNEYLVLGILVRSGTPWFYVASTRANKQLQLVPAVLFTSEWCDVPRNWRIRLPAGHNVDIEMLPESLALVDRWFEKYVNDDVDVMTLVEREIDYARRQV